MSRLDFNEITNNDESIQKPFAKLYNQSYCNYCFDAHTNNMVGCLSLKAGLWFCGPTCQTMYSYDNKLVYYTPELTVELQRLRKKFYSSEKLDKLRKMQHR